MEKEIINNAFSMTVPEGFLRMSAGELAQLFRDNNPNRWGVWDHERHAVVTVQWQQYSSLLLHLADLKSIAKRNEQLTRRCYQENGYRLDGFFSRRVCGMAGEGYRYACRPGDTDQEIETVLIKKGSVVYSLNCIGRPENRQANQALFDAILDGMQANPHQS